MDRVDDHAVEWQLQRPLDVSRAQFRPALLNIKEAAMQTNPSACASFPSQAKRHSQILLTAFHSVILRV